MHVQVLQPNSQLPPVETLRLAARRPDSHRHVLVIPGNPGSAWFYVPFMVELHARLGEQVHVVALSFPGHEATPLPTRCLSLTATITLVESLLAGYSATDRVTLIGHSIGAYIAIQALQGQHCKAESVQVVGLFPFLQFDATSPKQIRTRWMAGQLPLMRRLMAVVRAVLPASVKRALAARIVHHPHAVSAAVRLLQDKAVSSSLTLARHELWELDCRFESVLPLQQHKDDVVVYYTLRDDWCPDAHRHRIEAILGADRCLALPGVAHSFCIDMASSRKVASRVAEHLSAAWLNSA